MKATVAILLAIVGIFCLGFGTAAWAQSTYQCTYNCSQACGSLVCYSVNMACDGGGTACYITNDTTKYGGCVMGGSGCTTGTYTCKNKGYGCSDKTCSSKTPCLISKTVNNTCKCQ